MFKTKQNRTKNVQHSSDFLDVCNSQEPSAIESCFFLTAFQSAVLEFAPFCIESQIEMLAWTIGRLGCISRDHQYTTSA